MKSHISFLHGSDVFCICKPLFDTFNLNAFSYSRIYTDGSRAELWSDPYAMEHSFFGKKHIEKVYTPEHLGEEKVVLYEKKIEGYPAPLKERLENQILDQKQVFNHANALLICDNTGMVTNDYVEYFFFYTPQENNQAINIYLTHLDQIKGFCGYFKKRARALIQLADHNRLIKPWRDCHSSNKVENAIYHYDKKIIHITKKETELSYLLIEGKTAIEIAAIMHISKRTVEHHIENIKNKLNCRKKSELISAINKNVIEIGRR